MTNSKGSASPLPLALSLCSGVGLKQFGKRNKSIEGQKRINQNLDCLFKIDFKRHETYKMIVYLQKQLKYTGTRSVPKSIEDQMRENETTLDKLFTELKST